MAVRLGPDGLLYAVAEGTGAVQRYRNDTLEFVSTFTNNFSIGPTGLAFDSSGTAYLAAFNLDTVFRFDRNGTPLGGGFPTGQASLRGRNSRRGRCHRPDVADEGP